MSFLAFNSYYLIMPVPEMLTAFFVSVPLLLLDRSWFASRDLDFKLICFRKCKPTFFSILKGNQAGKDGAHLSYRTIGVEITGRR